MLLLALMLTAVLLACAAVLLVAGSAPTYAAKGDFSGLVDIGGGRTMYLECHGNGSPTVVLVSGARGAYDDWTHLVDSGGGPKPNPSGSAVFPKVGKSTRVCAYDRPGTTRMDGTLSASTPVVQPTTAQVGAADLHALLSAAKEPGPYVLVAHSWGGLIARFYASTYPDEVAGLVLLDAASEFLQRKLTVDQWDKFVQASKELGEPKELEAVDYQPSVDALPADPPVVEIPPVVLSADKCWFTFPGDDAAEAEATCSAWLAAQDQLATVLNAKHITDTNSGHFIQGEQPKLVIHSVRKVVEAARKNACALGVKNHGQCIKAEKHARR
jgi:pimeloyl-ACP methyl ester carboxylesterase